MTLWPLLYAGALQAGGPPIERIPTPSGWLVDDALCADLDGDARVDLVLASHALDKRFARRLAVHLARGTPPRFVAEPDFRLDATADVSAFTLADVHVDPGTEVVLFGATGAFLWRPRAAEDARFERLFACDFLWQLSDPEHLWALTEVARDLDGDRWVDLAVPEPGGWRLAFQSRDGARSSFERTLAVRVPREALASQRVVSIGRPRGSDEERSVRALRLEGQLEDREGDDLGFAGDLLSISESTPAAAFADWDADGDLDLVLQTERRLCVWPQSGPAQFDRDPSTTLPLPVPVERERVLDPSFSAQVRDLDGDRRLDYVVLASDKRSDEVRTQIQFFVQASQPAGAGLFGPKSLPTQLLVVAGFVGDASLDAVDRDPLPDLVLRTIRPDLIDQLRSISSESIDAELYVFLNARGTFPRKPDLAWRFPVRLRGFDPVARFVPDADRDGLAEFLVRSEPERMRLYAIAREREGLVVRERPIWELVLHEDARVLSSAHSPSGSVIVLEPGSAAWVTLR